VHLGLPDPMPAAEPKPPMPLELTCAESRCAAWFYPARWVSAGTLDTAVDELVVDCARILASRIEVVLGTTLVSQPLGSKGTTTHG
jgi:hypothetical protein